jgi:2-polyprenyl-3-methyl-5-hydroxy-6-metoxy-1,4-benzoquinol methylase
MTNEEMIGLQAEKHFLIKTADFLSIEEYVLHLMHTAAYIQASRLTANLRVLDFGCNTGYGTALLSQLTQKVVGVDVSKKAINAAKRSYGKLGIDFLRINGKRLPYADESFNAVVCLQVIEHVMDIPAFIIELKRMVPSAGMILFSTPNARLRLDPGMKPWNEFHVQEFNHTELKSLLENYFRNVDIFGLTAPETLYAIEVNRVARARENARATQSMPVAPLRVATPTRIKGRLLRDAASILRRLKALLSPPAKTCPISSSIPYTSDDFSYRRDGLDSALDFLAVCCDDDETFKTTVRKIGKSNGQAQGRG